MKELPVGCVFYLEDFPLQPFFYEADVYKFLRECIHVYERKVS
jgi:hypothetical protein